MAEGDFSDLYYAIQNGNELLMRQRFPTYTDALQSYAMNQYKVSKYLAEELTSRTLEKVFVKARNDDLNKPKTFLKYGLLVLRSLFIVESKKASRTVDLEEIYSLSYEDKTFHNEAFHKTLKVLDPEERELFELLVKYQEDSLRKVAKELGVSYGHVRVLKSRLKDKLEFYMTKYEHHAVDNRRARIQKFKAQCKLHHILMKDVIEACFPGHLGSTYNLLWGGQISHDKLQRLEEKVEQLIARKKQEEWDNLPEKEKRVRRIKAELQEHQIKVEKLVERSSTAVSKGAVYNFLSTGIGSDELLNALELATENLILRKKLQERKINQ